MLASGSEEALDALASWLAEGPPAARVERVLRQDWSGAPPAGFEIA